MINHETHEAHVKVLTRTFVENFSLTSGFSRVRKACEEKKTRLNGFSWAHSWFTALKRGVNEMISTEQHEP
ncbi:MAG TPA: hypothetical protein VIK53_03575 [Verrucomicrobiae bacterium]